jgi:hypothetical protein
LRKNKENSEEVFTNNPDPNSRSEINAKAGSGNNVKAE